MKSKPRKPRPESTSRRVASIASDLLRSPKTPKPSKVVAGSALTQTPNRPKPRRKKT